MKKMGKNYEILYIAFLLFCIIIAPGIILLKAEFPIACTVVSAVAFLAFVIFTLRFFTAEYLLSEKELTIKSGILFKRTRKISLSSILCRTEFSLFGKKLFTLISTYCGKFIIFATIDVSF